LKQWTLKISATVDTPLGKCAFGFDNFGAESVEAFAESQVSCGLRQALLPLMYKGGICHRENFSSSLISDSLHGVDTHYGLGCALSCIFPVYSSDVRKSNSSKEVQAIDVGSYSTSCLEYGK